MNDSPRNYGNGETAPGVGRRHGVGPIVAVDSLSVRVGLQLRRGGSGEDAADVEDVAEGHGPGDGHLTMGRLGFLPG